MTPLPVTPVAADACATAARGTAGPAGVRPGGPAGTRPGPPAPSGTARRLSAMTAGFVALFLEVEAGRRPRRHLEAVMTPMLYARLSDVWIRPAGAVAEVRSVRLVARTADTCDAVALVQRGPRCTAVAVRLVRRAPRGWLVDDVVRPETGPLPPPPYPVPAELADDDDGALPPVAATERDWVSPAVRG